MQMYDFLFFQVEVLTINVEYKSRKSRTETVWLDNWIKERGQRSDSSCDQVVDFFKRKI